MQQLQIPPLAEGETYLCGIVDTNGDVEHTVIIGFNGRAAWQDQLEWAKNLGGDLPNRVEQAVMFAKRRDLFEEEAYWSNEPLSVDSACAWCTFFNNGLQYCYEKSLKLRGVAVRRLKN